MLKVRKGACVNSTVVGRSLAGVIPMQETAQLSSLVVVLSQKFLVRRKFWSKGPKFPDRKYWAAAYNIHCWLPTSSHPDSGYRNHMWVAHWTPECFVRISLARYSDTDIFVLLQMLTVLVAAASSSFLHFLLNVPTNKMSLYLVLCPACTRLPVTSLLVICMENYSCYSSEYENFRIRYEDFSSLFSARQLNLLARPEPAF